MNLPDLPHGHTKHPILSDEVVKMFESHVAEIPLELHHLEPIMECVKYVKPRTLTISKFHWEALQLSGKIIINSKPFAPTYAVTLFSTEFEVVMDWNCIPLNNGFLLLISGFMDPEDLELKFWSKVVAGCELGGDNTLLDAVIKYGYGQKDTAVLEAVAIIMYG